MFLKKNYLELLCVNNDRRVLWEHQTTWYTLRIDRWYSHSAKTGGLFWEKQCTAVASEQYIQSYSASDRLYACWSSYISVARSMRIGSTESWWCCVEKDILLTYISQLRIYDDRSEFASCWNIPPRYGAHSQVHRQQRLRQDPSTIYSRDQIFRSK
jgi:hypothetical protein